jgi:cytochrome P450
MLNNPTAFSPLSPEFQSNPYPYYEMLRANMPVFHWDQWNMWLCTRYADVNDLLKDNRLGHEILRVMTRDELGWAPREMLPEKEQARIRNQSRWMLFRDPPDHTRLRTLVHKAFTPRMVERLRAHIETITDELIDRAIGQGGMDVIEGLAFALPVRVIAEMLGVPTEDQDTFSRWSRDLAGTLEFTESEAVYDKGADAVIEFDAYFRALAAERRKNPADDLLSALVQAEEAGDRLDEDEVIATLTLLLIAGHETTVNLIGNGTLALLENPAQFALLRNDLTLVKSATEELLRYDSPVQLTTRWVLEDMQHGDFTFRKGQQVALMFGAANRDPERFDNPDTLDITRENNKHVAFGSGIHFCLGAPLARLEGQIAFERIARRLPNLQLDGEPVRRDTYVLRGLRSLPVRV